jgi:serine/threonine protein kinase
MSFTLVEQIGKGGMGVVWKARDEQTGQIVALKLLRDLYLEDESYRRRFEHELEIARRITSPHVVKVLGFGSREGVPYIAFEFVDGPSLSHLIVRHGPYGWTDVRALLLQLAEGLADAHAAGVLHRDVKPSNILVDRSGTAKLVDFGISRAMDMTRVTRASGLLGTPAYLAPEGPVDARSDLYSLGVVAFELLTGSPPFEASTYHEVLVAHLRKPPDLTRVPLEARPIVAWLLAKEPHDRPQSAHQLVRVLTGAEGIPRPRPVAAAYPDRGIRPAADQTTLAAPRDAASWSGLAVADPSRPSSGPARQSSAAVIAGAIAVIGVVGAVAAVSLSRSNGSLSPTTAPTAAAPTAGAPTATANLGGGDGSGPTTTTAAAPAAVEAGRWLDYGSLPEGVWGNGVTQFGSGQVAIFSASSGSPSSPTLETWTLDPKTGSIAGGPAMARSQAVPAVAVFNGGSVMIAGGWGGSNPISDAEILDASTGSFTAVASMAYPRSQATATDIGNGRVLVAGGWTQYDSGSSVFTATASAEIYNINTRSWSAAASMSTPRALATATRLQDGRVLVAGGDSGWQGPDAPGANQQVLSSAEIYNPANDAWQNAGNMSVPRATQSASLLSNGHVLLTGGWSDGSQLGLVSTDEFVPGTGWHKAADMPGPHGQARLVALKDGRLLEVGGVGGSGNATAETDLYDPDTGTWQRSGDLLRPLYWPAIVVLSDGRVLLVGGADDNISSRLELYTPPPR